MKWINEPIKDTGYSETMLALTPRGGQNYRRRVKPSFKNTPKEV